MYILRLHVDQCILERDGERERARARKRERAREKENARARARASACAARIGRFVLTLSGCEHSADDESPVPGASSSRRDMP